MAELARRSPRMVGSADGGWHRVPPWDGRDAGQQNAHHRRVHGARLTGFDIADNGGLSNRRVWAALDGAAPDGICLDAEDAVWYADVPNKRCVRVGEGGDVLQTIGLDRGCFACALGGAEGKRCSWWSPIGLRRAPAIRPEPVRYCASRCPYRASVEVSL